MSWRATAFVKELPTGATGKPQLTVSEKFLALLLADAYLDEDQRAICDIPKLARWLLVGERQTLRLIRGLERKQVIRVMRHRNEDGQPIKGRANEYQFVGLDGVTILGDMGDMLNCHANTKNGKHLACQVGSVSGDTGVIPTEEKLSTKKEHPTKLPGWIPVEPWQGWLEMRKAKRAPLTERAKKLAIEKLERLRKTGQDPGAILDQSTLRGWTGLFPLKRDPGRGEGEDIGTAHLEPQL